MSRIVWLASYPKSGNTWFRAFLSGFCNQRGISVDINHLNDSGSLGISSDRFKADNVLGLECCDLTPDEIDRWRPEIYRSVAKASDQDAFIKTHDAYTMNAAGEPIFPADVSRAVIYIVRNPLDVSVSLTHHSMRTLDEIIDRMGREDTILAEPGIRLHSQLHQRTLSWSHHVRSWLDQKAIRLHWMRYEDMCRQPEEEFRRAVEFLGLEGDMDRVRSAVKLASFERLQEQERARGFKEKPLQSRAFFRSGRAGGWRAALNSRQVEQILHDHGSVMERLEYLQEMESIA